MREEVIPVYMGLIKQIDDQMGVLFRFLEDNGYFDNTMIVFTSDHGDYLGDHWLGEKELFHEPSVKIPLIIYDPSETANATRGTTCDELVEAIDLAPTFLRSVRRRSGAAVASARRPLADAAAAWPRSRRTGAHYVDQRIRLLDPVRRASSTPRRATSGCSWSPTRTGNTSTPSATGRCCSISQTDPQELHDLGADPTYDDVCQRYAALLAEWGLRSVAAR